MGQRDTAPPISSLEKMMVVLAGWWVKLIRVWNKCSKWWMVPASMWAWQLLLLPLLLTMLPIRQWATTRQKNWKQWPQESQSGTCPHHRTRRCTQDVAQTKINRRGCTQPVAGNSQIRGSGPGRRRDVKKTVTFYLSCSHLWPKHFRQKGQEAIDNGFRYWEATVSVPTSSSNSITGMLESCRSTKVLPASSRSIC